VGGENKRVTAAAAAATVGTERMGLGVDTDSGPRE